MAESNITREHEGKHGVLTLGGSHNDVTIEWLGDDYFGVLIDTATDENTLRRSDGWQFTPDPDPLPTEPGWYMQTSEAGCPSPVLYFLMPHEIWYSHFDSAVTQEDVDFMTGAHADDPLVRVSFGVAS